MNKNWENSSFDQEKKKIEGTDEKTGFRNERELITDTTDIKRMIKEYYEQYYANKLDYLN